jgi:hypothetical protein
LRSGIAMCFWDFNAAMLLNSKADEVLANSVDFCGAEPMIR